MKTQYKEVQGMFFNAETPDQVCNILAQLNKSRKRVKIFMGKDGKNWREEFDTVGTIGKSTGDVKIPLLIKTARSYGGGAILDDCILKIRDTKSGLVLYQHPTFKEPVFKIEDIKDPELLGKGYNVRLFVDGELYANCPTLAEIQKIQKRLI